MMNEKDFHDMLEALLTPEERDRMLDRALTIAKAKSAHMTEEERLHDARVSMFQHLANAGVEFIAEAAAAVDTCKSMNLVPDDDTGWRLVAEVQNIYFRQFQLFEKYKGARDKDLDRLYEKEYGLSIKDELKGGKK